MLFRGARLIHRISIQFKIKCFLWFCFCLHNKCISMFFKGSKLLLIIFIYWVWKIQKGHFCDPSWKLKPSLVSFLKIFFISLEDFFLVSRKWSNLWFEIPWRIFIFRTASFANVFYKIINFYFSLNRIKIFISFNSQKNLESLASIN